jgi:hypothetical protein
VIPAQRSHTDPEDDEDEVEQNVEETKSAEELGTFGEVMVWNHDVPWDASEDAYAKGIGEWMSFANAVSFILTTYSMITYKSSSDSCPRRTSRSFSTGYEGRMKEYKMNPRFYD